VSCKGHLWRKGRKREVNKMLVVILVASLKHKYSNSQKSEELGQKGVKREKWWE
jgi:hypothetical protein